MRPASEGVIARAIVALFVDPDTGAPIDCVLDRVSLVIGIILSVPLLIAMLAIALGLGGGR